MTAYAIDPSLLQESEAAESLPWLVASDYKPRTLGDELTLCLETECLEKLSKSAQEILLTVGVPTQVILGNERRSAIDLSNVQWVIPCRPARGFIEEKIDGKKQVRRQVSGETWNKDTMSSANRLFLICIIDGVPVTNDSGEPQLFTLNLGGFNRAKWIYDSAAFNGRHIDGLNAYWLKKQKKELANAGQDTSGIKSNMWVLHLCSIAIEPAPYSVEYEGTVNIHTKYHFVPNAQPKNLSPEEQRLITDFVRSDYFQELKKDPFGVDRKQVQPESVAAEDAGRPINSYQDEGGGAFDHYPEIPF